MISVGRVGFLLRHLDGQVQRFQVVDVAHVLHVPVPAHEARGHIVGEGQRSAAFDGDVVVVVEPDEIGQAEMAGQGSSFVADAFHQVAIAAEGVNAIVEEIAAFAVELRSQPALRNGHADGVAAALAQRPGRSLHAGRVSVFRMAGCLRSPLAELLEVVQRNIEAGEIQHGIQQHGGVAVGQHEAVASRPMRIVRVKAQIAVPQHEGQRRQRHRRSRMSAVRLLHRVHGEGTDGVDAKLLQLFLFR